MSIDIFSLASRHGGAIPLTDHLAHQYDAEAMLIRVERDAARNGQRGRKYDGCDSDEKIDDRHFVSQWRPFLDACKADGADDADIAMAAQGLTSFIQQVYERKHPELPAWNGDILPIETSLVDPAADTYVWWDRDLSGDVGVASTYNEDSIPLVAGPTATPNTGRIKPFLNGWRTNFMTKRREALARRNNRPDFRNDEGKRDGAERAHAEAINAQWLWGDPSWSIPGLMNETRIRVIPAPNGLGGSPLWANKTADEIIFDINTMANAIHLYSNNTLRADTLLLPQSQFDFIAGTPRTSGTDTSVLQFVLGTFKDKGQPLKIRGVQEFNADKSQAYAGGPNNLLFDRAVVIASNPQHASFVLSQRPEMPMGPRQTPLGELMIMHSRAGGLRLMNAQSIIFFDNI